jgi:hypothetical protein
MAIGAVVPGEFVDITPDVLSEPYTVVQGCPVDGLVRAEDIWQAIQVALNIQSLGRLGAEKFEHVGDASDMVALDTTAGDIFYVFGQGPYIQMVGANPYAAPLSYQSTPHPTRHWLSPFAGATSIYRGLCRVGPLEGIDEDTPVGRIPKSVVPNALVGIYDWVGSARAALTLTPGTNGIVTSHVLNIPALQTGDIVSGTVEAISASCTATSTANEGKLEVEMISGYSVSHLTPAVIGMNNALSAAFHGGSWSASIPFRGAVTDPGTCRLQLRLTSPASYNMSVYGLDGEQFRIGNVHVYRP